MAEHRAGGPVWWRDKYSIDPDDDVVFKIMDIIESGRRRRRPIGEMQPLIREKIYQYGSDICDRFEERERSLDRKLDDSEYECSELRRDIELCLPYLEILSDHCQKLGLDGGDRFRALIGTIRELKIVINS